MFSFFVYRNITKYTECKHNYERDILKLGFSLDEKEMEISIRESIIQYVCLFDSETLSCKNILNNKLLKSP